MTQTRQQQTDNNTGIPNEKGGSSPTYHNIVLDLQYIDKIHNILFQ